MGDWAGQVFVEGEIPFSLNGGFWPRNVGNALSFSRPMFIGKVVDRLLIPSGAKNLVRQAVRVMVDLQYRRSKIIKTCLSGYQV
jgi:hypothetical protein